MHLGNITGDVLKDGFEDTVGEWVGLERGAQRLQSP